MKTLKLALMYAVLAIVPYTQSTANGLGEGDWNGLFFKTYFGTDAQISNSGQIRFNWIDPATNNVQEVSFRQSKIIRVPDEIRQIVAGKQVSCAVVLETNSTTYARCSIFLEGWSEGGATPVLELVSNFDDGLIGCDPTEQEGFRNSNVFQCAEGN